MPHGKITDTETSASTQTVAITTSIITANSIGVNFSTPNGNQPNSYANNLYIWQSGNEIPWSSDALDSQSITVNTPSGDALFNNLNVTSSSYIIGYAVGGPVTGSWTKYPNVVSSVFVPAAGTDGEPFSPSVSVASPGSTSFGAQIEMAEGFLPKSSNTYVGVWEGNSASYTTPPKWYEQATSDNNNSLIAFNNVQLLRGTTYTMGLFSTGYNSSSSSLNQKTLAAVSSFTI